MPSSTASIRLHTFPYPPHEHGKRPSQLWQLGKLHCSTFSLSSAATMLVMLYRFISDQIQLNNASLASSESSIAYIRTYIENQAQKKNKLKRQLQSTLLVRFTYTMANERCLQNPSTHVATESTSSRSLTQQKTRLVGALRVAAATAAAALCVLHQDSNDGRWGLHEVVVPTLYYSQCQCYYNDYQFGHSASQLGVNQAHLYRRLIKQY